MFSIVKRMGLAIALGSFLLLGVAPQAVADNCQDRVRRAEENLRKAVDRHGERSRQAEKARHNLENERAKCHLDEHHDHPDHPDYHQ